MPAPFQAETAVISSFRKPKIKNTSQMSDSLSFFSLTKHELQELIEKRETLHRQVLRLHSILERTCKAVGDVARKHDGRELRNKTFKDNLRLQQDTEKRVHELREEMFEIDKKIATAMEPEENNEAASSSPTSTNWLEEENQYDVSEVSSTSAPRYEFFDPGGHWCPQCNEIHSDLDSYLKHLHSKSHSDRIDPNEQAWISKKFCKPKPKVSSNQPLETIRIKGTQFILPIKGYLCKICQVFMVNISHAEDHLNSEDHDRLYNRYKSVNRNQEPECGVNKAGMINRASNGRKRKRELENEKLQIETRQGQRILREKTEENRSKTRREVAKSDDVDSEQEKNQPHRNGKSSAFKNRRISEVVIDSSDDSDGSSVQFCEPPDSVESTQLPTPVSTHYDKKLSMKVIVDIPKSEWQPCFYRVLKRMIIREVSDATEKVVQDESPDSNEEILISPQDSGIGSQEEPVIDSTSSSLGALSSQVPNSPDLYSNDYGKTPSINKSLQEKSLMGNPQDHEQSFSMEEDDDEEIEMDSWQINEATEASPSVNDENTSRWSISSQGDSLPHDPIEFEIEQRIEIYPAKSKEERLEPNFLHFDQSKFYQDSYVDLEDLKPTLILDPPLNLDPNQLDLTSPESTRKNSINDILTYLYTP